MNVASMRTLFEYHIWANRQLWQCVETVNEEQFTQAHDYSIGSIHNQVFHLLFTDWLTFAMVQGNLPDQDDPAYLQQEEFPSRTSIRSKWNEVEEQIRAGLDALTDEQLQNVISSPKGDGTTFDARLWELLYTAVNHGTNHRAQTLALLEKLGGKTVEQGAYYYLMER